MPETRLPRYAAWAWLLIAPSALLPWAAQAQRFDGPVAGTLDCPARSIFESGSTQVRGNVRGGQMTVGLGPLTVSGRIVELGPQPAVRLEGSGGGGSASFDGLVIGANQVHARGIVNEQPCNLNLTLTVAAAPPGRQAAALQQVRGLPSLDGPWSGTVTCPLRDLSGDDRITARGSMVDNVLTVDFASVRVQGRVAGVSPRPGLRLEGSGARGVGAGFDATMVTPNRIEARGVVGNQPCTVSLTRTLPAAPLPTVQAPQAPPASALPAKPAPTNQAAPAPSPPVASQVDKPAPSNAPPANAAREPPIATITPRQPPAPSAATPPPVVPPASAPAPRAPSGAADQLACALAGTCATPPR
ncbi:hypothetical protein [Falsiroseomonas sp. HW251]|uniref:hypothetical protein n=1 Tax=Falsiroseomonas sp. HW251 TaxID=3390998 RepID=UPI003D317B66